MHVIQKESDLDALADPELLDLIRQRITEALEYVDVFSDLVTFIVVEPEDQMGEINGALSFSVMTNRFTGFPFGHPSFTPHWDVLCEHPGWFEMVFVLSDEGSGVTLFVPKYQAMHPDLLLMCRQFAVSEEKS